MNTVKAIAVETIVIDCRSMRSIRPHHQVVSIRLRHACLEAAFGEELLIEDEDVITIHPLSDLLLREAS
ncbi:hypothetical protein SynBIOSU31_02504 [Synechococcus sp. BIOS-U3-1]|nr:hypothetical protein SynBIOSU31_02504 [Synechococcus sp. BIOS-U3-1]